MTPFKEKMLALSWDVGTEALRCFQLQVRSGVYNKVWGEFFGEGRIGRFAEVRVAVEAQVNRQMSKEFQRIR